MSTTLQEKLIGLYFLYQLLSTLINSSFYVVNSNKKKEKINVKDI